MRRFLPRLAAASIAFAATLTTAGAYEGLDNYPYLDPAIPMADSSIVVWADGYTNLTFGTDVAAYMDPALALGPAAGTSYDVLCLGRGGEVTLTFSGGIRDGEGFDFAVFENGFNEVFLELAHVEVSSDGANFLRFPNYSLNTSSATVDAKKIFGLAGKFRQGLGTPFDLNELTLAHDAALAGDTDFSSEFTTQLTNGYPLLDLKNITHVRLIDVIGDGASSHDSRGLQVYDPYPTQITAGFDLDAIAVLHQPTPDGLPQAIAFDPIPHQKLDFGSLELGAAADSGLPVVYLVTGPATITNATLYFSSTGIVEVVAHQVGDATYAPASPVLRSFQVAAEIQHIYVEPIANQLQNGGTVQVRAYSSSGLPVKAQVRSGPDSLLIDENSLALDLGTEMGPVRIRFYQPGDAVHSPAEDVLMDFELVASGAPNAPISFAGWLLTSNSIPKLALTTSLDAYGRAAVTLAHPRDPRAAATSRILVSTDLNSWTNAVPEIIALSESNVVTRLPATATNAFFRLEFEGR